MERESINSFSTRAKLARAVVAGLASITISACVQAPLRRGTASSTLDNAAYDQLINRYTRHEEQYNGFNERFDVYATMLTNAVQAAILKERGRIYQWTLAQAQDARDKMFQKNSTETQFAVSFFVPNIQLNNLDQPETIWRIYLDAGGNRYIGHAKRRDEPLETIQAMFPYDTRFHKAYVVTFNVPLAVIENQTATLIFASAQGLARLKFTAGQPRGK